MNIFFQHLNSPEYMHVLLNPVPVYGLAIGVVGLLLAVIACSRSALAVGSLTRVVTSDTKNSDSNRHRRRGNTIMSMSIRIFAAAFCALWLIGCAANFQSPPLSMTNPASVQAKESVTPVAKPMLGRDAITEKTNERLATNAATNPSLQPSEMQQMHHDMKGMEGMQRDASGAMKMDSGEKKPATGKFYYTCVTHSQIHQDKPGKCPICGMALIKKEEGEK